MFYSYSSLGALFPLHLNSKMFPLSVPYIIPLSGERIGGRIHISPYIYESEILQSSSSGGSGCRLTAVGRREIPIAFDFEKAFDLVNLALSKSNLSCVIHIIGYTK